MKPFKEFFDDYCLSNEELEVEQTFIKFNLIDVAQNVYTRFCENKGIPQDDIRIKSLASKFLITATHNVSGVGNCNETEKAKMELILFDLSEKMLLEFSKNNKRNSAPLISQIQNVFNTKTSEQYNYNQVPYDKLLKLKLFKLKRQGSPVIDEGNENIILLSEKRRKIYWQEKGNLPKLVDILKKKRFINSQQELFSFFQPERINIKVHWNAEKKDHLAYLLHCLFSEGYAIITGDGDYFCCAEALFCDMKGNPFEQNSLNERILKIYSEKPAYMQVIDEVDEIIYLITKQELMN